MKRRIVQLIGFLATNSYFAGIPRMSFYQGTLKGVCVPVLNCYACPMAWGSCPIGTLQHFLIVRAFPFYVLGTIGAIGLFIGRWPCGWLCPFGWLQDIVNKVKVRNLKLPDWVRHTKFVVLIVVVGIIAWVTMEPWFCKICPAGTLGAGLPWLVFKSQGSGWAEGMDFTTWMFKLKIVVLLGFLVFMMYVKRPFCRFLCPLGALFGLTNKISLLQLNVNLDSCAIAYAKGSDFTNCATCNHCSRHCPMDLKVPEQIDSVDCIRCMNCTSYGSPEWSFRFKREHNFGAPRVEEEGTEPIVM